MGCYNDFANKHAEAMRRNAPRTEPLETPIQDPKKTLGIKLPFLVMIIKNLKKYFTFEVQVS